MCCPGTEPHVPSQNPSQPKAQIHLLRTTPGDRLAAAAALALLFSPTQHSQSWGKRTSLLCPIFRPSTLELLWSVTHFRFTDWWQRPACQICSILVRESWGTRSALRRREGPLLFREQIRKRKWGLRFSWWSACQGPSFNSSTRKKSEQKEEHIVRNA